MDHARGRVSGTASEYTYWPRWSAAVTSRRLVFRAVIVSGFRGCRSATIRLTSASGAAMGTAPASIAASHAIERSFEMDKDRIDGAAKTVGGKVKEAVGKLTGDQKTVAEGQGEQKVGKVQNAVGGLKDTVRDIQKAK